MLLLDVVLERVHLSLLGMWMPPQLLALDEARVLHTLDLIDEN